MREYASPPATHRIGLIGGGIAGSLSPALHEHEAAALGLDYNYTRLDIDTLGVPPAEVLRAALADGYNGFNITHPCKQILLSECDDLSPDAAALGAVNTILVREGQLVGHNTDHSGFTTSLRTGLPGAPLSQVAVIGAGGAGSAVSYGLLKAGTEALTVLDLDLTRAEGLSDRLASKFDEAVISAHRVNEIRAVTRTVNGIVNATPIGMDGHPGTPFDPTVLNPNQWVADVVYHPQETALLAAAKTIGCRVLGGLSMLVAQAAESLTLFSGLVPDRSRMQSDLLTLIAATHRR